MKTKDDFKIEMRFVDLTIGEATLKLTIEQIKQLRDALNAAFPVQSYIPYYHPYYPYWYSVSGETTGSSTITSASSSNFVSILEAAK